MTVELFNNVLNEKNNKKLIDELVKIEWFIGTDGDTNSKLKKLKENKLGGFAIITSENNILFNKFFKINTLVKSIVEHIVKIKKFDITKIFIKRILCNLYLKNHIYTKNHVDDSEENFFSLIYNPMNTDGGTIINNIKYTDKKFQAKLFKSNILHRGLGPVNDNYRFNVNIVFKT